MAAAPPPASSAARTVPVYDSPGTPNTNTHDVSEDSGSTATYSASVLTHLIIIYKWLRSHSSTFQDGLPVPKSQSDFLKYMSSSVSNAMAPPRTQDFSYPISNYYISSSHNTYLSGNQFYGDASTAAYTNVLRRGCRCLEIDVWDGVSHGPSAEANGSNDDQAEDGGKRSTWSKLTDKLHQKIDSSSSRSNPSASTADARGAGESHLGAEDHQAQRTGLQQTVSGNLEPRVLHGHTLTKEVPFRAVCEAIRDAAFVTSSLPVIVSLEVHATLDTQKMMVDIMHEVWAGHLVNTSEVLESAKTALPSPEALHHKILVKTKWSPHPETGESTHPLDQIQSNESEDATSSTMDSQQKSKASKLLAALSELGVYTRAYTFKSFDQPEATLPTHVFSLSEAKVADMHSDPRHGPALFNHNRNFLMRVFPSGRRINSSNVEPSFLWRQGAQMVALNWQSLDKGMMLNEGMFAGEGGWVLKPAGYRGKVSPSSQSGMFVDPTAPVRQVISLEVTVYAAQNVSSVGHNDTPFHGKLHPYVVFELHVDTHGDDEGGHGTAPLPSMDDDDEGDNSCKRRTKAAKSSDPDFGGETVSWTGVSGVVQELSFLRLKVKDDRAIGRDEMCAWACIRLDRLQTGYRFVHLLDTKGSMSSSLLFVKVIKNVH